MTTYTSGGITALLDLNKCSDYFTFDIEGNSIRVHIVGTCEDTWFCGQDVCEILGYSDKKLALQEHVRSEDKRSLSEFSQNDVGPEGPTLIGQNNLTTDHNQGGTVYINGSGLLDLIALMINSKKPKTAKSLLSIVFGYILPTLRKHGKVIIEEIIVEIRKQYERDLERIDQELQKANERARVAQEIAEVTQEIQETIRRLENLNKKSSRIPDRI